MGSSSVSFSGTGSSLVLDGERRELVRAPIVRIGRKGGEKGSSMDAKTALALKNHSDAERRRRERINSHLAVLRGMIHGTEKLDKAGLLAEVINRVKELKTSATEHSKGHTVPSDTDELTIQCEGQTANSNSLLIRATLCCEDCRELFTDLKQTLKQTLNGLHLKLARAEISTLSGRVKIVLLILCETSDRNEVINRGFCIDSVRNALKSMLDRVNSPVDFLPRSSLLNKRRKVSHFESSSSS